MKVKLAPHEAHFSDELSGITLSRIQEDVPTEMEMPKEFIYDDVLNRMTMVVEQNVSNLRNVRRAIDKGILIPVGAAESKGVSPTLEPEELAAIQGAKTAKDKAQLLRNQLRERAKKILALPVNEAKSVIRSIKDLETLDTLILVEQERKKPRKSMLDVVLARMRADDIAGPGLVKIIEDDEDEQEQEPSKEE